MTPSKEATGNGDSIQIKFGGDFVRKLLPYLLGASVLGGGALFKSQHDSEMESLKTAQTRIEGKVDIIVDLLKDRRHR